MSKLRVVRIKDLKSGMVLGRTIIGNQGQILLKQGVVLTEGYIDYLKKYPLGAVYIFSGKDVIVEDVISDRTRLQAIQGTREMVEQVKRGVPLEAEKINQVLISIIDELLLQDEIMINLVDLRSFNEDLFSHSVNVAILATIVGIELNYHVEKLKILAQAALLHDLGQLFINENNFMDHVELGVELLHKYNFNKNVLEPILHHHERWDGNGYPNRIQNEEINELARIIQVANIFDLLSTNTYYSLEEVIEYLMANSGHEFDPLCVRTFINCVSFFPVGTEVKLNTGETGIVIQANKGFPTRPIIRVKKNMYGHQMEQGYTVDLLEKTTYFVTQQLDDLN